MPHLTDARAPTPRLCNQTVTISRERPPKLITRWEYTMNFDQYLPSVIEGPHELRDWY